MSGHPSETEAARSERGLKRVTVRLEPDLCASLDAIVKELGLPPHGGRYGSGGRAEALRELIRRNRQRPLDDWAHSRHTVSCRQRR